MPLNKETKLKSETGYEISVFQWVRWAVYCFVGLVINCNLINNMKDKCMYDLLIFNLTKSLSKKY